MQLHARNRIESSVQSRTQRKCPTSSEYKLVAANGVYPVIHKVRVRPGTMSGWTSCYLLLPYVQKRKQHLHDGTVMMGLDQQPIPLGSRL